MLETEAELQFRNRLRSGARRVRGSGLKVAPNCRCGAPARTRDCRYSNQLHRGVFVLSPTLAPDRKWLALALLALAQFVVVLDASIVNVALPSIGRDLQFSQENLSWVVNAYTLTFGGFLLLGGRLADLL